MSDRPSGRTYARDVFRLAVLSGAPALLTAGVLLWRTEALPRLVQAGIWLLLVALWAWALARLRGRVAQPLRSIANVLAGIRQGDLALRASGEDPDDPLGLVALEANRLADRLRQRRLDAREKGLLLERVMEEIDAAVFAFDHESRLRLVNRAGAQLLDTDVDELRGRPAAQLALDRCLEADPPPVLEASFPGRGPGRWEVRRSAFRLDGRPHHLLLLTDVSRLLRREERRAWRRLIRVLSHEINNSLAPIRSVAESLRDRLEGAATADDGEAGTAGDRSADAETTGERSDQVRRGLELIARRAESLNRFMASYAELARLPDPEPERMDVESWIRGVCEMETRRPVEVEPGPDATIRADADQMEQLLVNLLDNAVGAAAETDGSVRVEWSVAPETVEVRVLDEGPGIADDANLFVPFFTTKEDGSGIGLALGREIVEAHGGTLTLENREDGPGCVARVRLPREA